MDRLLLVTIDLDLLRSHLAAEDEYPHSRSYVFGWLKSAGFTFIGDGTWAVREADLGQLAPEEYEIRECAAAAAPGADLWLLN